jgi:hypothetical protein
MSSTKKKSSNKRNQKGGGDLSSESFYDGRDQNSYKIQLVYYKVPPAVSLMEHSIDTPYRFRTAEEALSSADILYPGLISRIVASSDKPDFNEQLIDRVKAKQLRTMGTQFDVMAVEQSAIKQPVLDMKEVGDLYKKQNSFDNSLSKSKYDQMKNSQNSIFNKTLKDMTFDEMKQLFDLFQNK